MACLIEVHCVKCGQTKQVLAGYESPVTKCDECREKEKAQKRRTHFAGLKALTLEERITKIEEWVYDYKPPREARF